MASVLLLTIFLPLLGAALMWVVAPLGDRVVRWTALLITIATAASAGVVLREFPANGEATANFALTETPWLGDGSLLDIRFSVSLDGLGVWLFGLTALLMITAVLVSWESIKERVPLFFGMLLLLEFGCLGVFTARDLILFYIFFEFTLIPLFFLIGVWGSEDRRYAAVKFFLFTLAGSLLTFLGLLTLVYYDYQNAGLGIMRFSIPLLTESLQAQSSAPGIAGQLPQAMQVWVFVALFAGLAIKVPLFPLHTWLPLAHVQAPTAGSVILAGVLLKIGTYGFLRFCIPMLPSATVACMPWVLWLSVIGIIYGALVALAQGDIKRLIAYSSVSHLGYCMLGLFALNRLGVQGGTLQMVNHGISTGALFALVGMIYERYHTREIKKLGGLARCTPCLAFFMLLFTFSSIGLPGLNGFAGEFLVLIGMFQRAWLGSPEGMQWNLMCVAVLSVSGVVLGAWYMLYLVQRVFFGPVAKHVEDHDTVKDLSLREIVSLAPLAVLAVWIGLQPKFFLDRMAPTLNASTVAVERELDDVLAAAPQAGGLGDKEKLAGVR